MSTRTTFTAKKISVALAALFLAVSSTLSAKTVLLNSNTNWSSITTGSGTNGVPNASDDIIVYGTTGSGAATLTIDVAKAEAKSLQLGQINQPRTGEITINNGNKLIIYGLFDAQKPTNSKDNIITFGNATSEFIVMGITSGAYYISSPSTRTATVNPNLISPLPVELVSFNANKIDEAQVRLDWSTAWEVNNRGFEVERSTNGVYWTNVGFVEGHGNSTSLLNYTFATPIAGINTSMVYFRLKQVDFNGKFEYSPVRTVRLNGATAKVEGIYPNPAMNRISVNLGNVEAGNTAKITILDMTGKVIMVSEQMIEAGSTALDMNIENLKTGNYIVNISSANTSYNTKLIKL